MNARNEFGREIRLPQQDRQELGGRLEAEALEANRRHQALTFPLAHGPRGFVAGVQLDAASPAVKGSRPVMSS